MNCFKALAAKLGLLFSLGWVVGLCIVLFSGCPEPHPSDEAQSKERPDTKENNSFLDAGEAVGEGFEAKESDTIKDKSKVVTKTLDCKANDARCPEFTISGHPLAKFPGGDFCPFRGYGDPSIRKDPKSSRLWMSYSYLSMKVAPPKKPGDKPIVDRVVGLHLAASDDKGKTWKKMGSLYPVKQEVGKGPKGGPGYSIHEVSTLAHWEHQGKGLWHLLYFRYFNPVGPEGRRVNSFTFRTSWAQAPAALGSKEKRSIGFPATHKNWGTSLSLSSLDTSLSGCFIWTEASLFSHSGKLYLLAQCLKPIDAKTRDYKNEFLGLFVAKDRSEQKGPQWKWIGKLTGAKEAKELGGEVLTQAELTTARDGSLLLIVSPKIHKDAVQHKGCRVLKLESLEPPRLARNSDNSLVLRADIRSSDSTGIGPGLCSYSPASDIGVVMVRTEFDLTIPKLVFKLHKTNIHP